MNCGVCRFAVTHEVVLTFFNLEEWPDGLIYGDQVKDQVKVQAQGLC